MQILSVYVLIRGLQSWGSVYMDAVGRPEVTFWTQLASLCLTPVAVVVGVHWGIEGVAVVLRDLPDDRGRDPDVHHRAPADAASRRGRVAARLSGIAAAALVMAVACLLGRAALEARASGWPARAALTIGLGIVVYVPALWWLAPQRQPARLRARQERLAQLIDARRRRPSCNLSADEP